MTSPLMALVDTARMDHTVECFVVSPVTWNAIEKDAQAFAYRREGVASTIEGTGQMQVMGIPVARTRMPWLRDVPFIEAHARSERDLQPVIKRIL